ncbi:MAG TPA: DUF1579 family protein [Rhodanobacteraceae bacterium]|jgi:hypothetical protein|nr:DUF1579 family protein [Rhodanobacteraceae bacterium]
MMDMPKPGAEHARLARFAGSWSGDEELSDSPWGPGGAAIGRCEMREAVDGMALVQDYTEEKGGQAVFRGHGVFTIDPANGDVLWWWFDSMGFPPDPPARGRWNGDRLLFEKKMARGEARYEFVFGGDHYDFRIENRFPGQSEFVVFMKGRYRRQH